MNHMGHHVLFTRSDKGIEAHAYHEGSGTKLELERANGVSELPVELAPDSWSSISGIYSSPSALEQIEDMRINIVKAERPN